MENHDKTTTGSVRIITYNPAGQITSSNSFTTQSLRDIVTNYSTSNGDRKAPNNFKYDAYRDMGYRGSTRILYNMGGGNRYLGQTNDGVFGSFLSMRIQLPADRRSFHYNRALSRLYDMIRGQLDLSVAVAEASETKRMLNAFERVDKALFSVPPGVKDRSANWRTPLRALGGKWLEWHLGWKPLIQDMYGAIDEFYRHKVPALLTVRAKSQEQFPKSLSVAKLYSNDPAQFAFGTGIQGVAFHLCFQDKGGFDLNRWTSLNPASIAWELLPLSFVFDYVYDVGSMLRSLETSLLYDSLFVDGYWTQLYAGSYAHDEVGLRNNGGDPIYIYQASASYDVKRFERSRLSGMPAPKLPTFVLPTSWQQLITLASLAAVRLPKWAIPKR